MQDGEPAHDGVEVAVGQRMAERIAADMRDTTAEAAAVGEIGCDRMHLRLQLERRDVTTDRMCEISRRPADTGADLENSALGR